jgi:inositol polyphosphate 5-phosphatase INPP5B/F
VNGKLPSQDLSGWISGHAYDDRKISQQWEALIPPLKEISPLSIGETIKHFSEEKGTFYFYKL